ncbi:MAG: hypothetical protein V7K32_19950 [Nostoc sp.]|uniref:hypothetical protein n=1 Tax=Nostoc sp. TaxID=1180 RepID=UPI002FF97C43
MCTSVRRIGCHIALQLPDEPIPKLLLHPVAKLLQLYQPNAAQFMHPVLAVVVPCPEIHNCAFADFEAVKGINCFIGKG